MMRKKYLIHPGYLTRSANTMPDGFVVRPERQEHFGFARLCGHYGIDPREAVNADVPAEVEAAAGWPLIDLSPDPTGAWQVPKEQVLQG